MTKKKIPGPLAKRMLASALADAAETGLPRYAVIARQWRLAGEKATAGELRKLTDELRGEYRWFDELLVFYELDQRPDHYWALLVFYSALRNGGQGDVISYELGSTPDAVYKMLQRLGQSGDWTDVESLLFLTKLEYERRRDFLPDGEWYESPDSPRAKMLRKHVKVMQRKNRPWEENR